MHDFFLLAGREVQLSWRDRRHIVTVGSVRGEGRYDTPEIRDRLHNRERLVFTVDGQIGSIDTTGRPRRLRIECGDLEWTARRRPWGGLSVSTAAGEDIGVVGPWSLDILPSTSDMDLVVALTLALYELDRVLAPYWLLWVDTLIPVLDSWPKPIHVKASRKRRRS